MLVICEDCAKKYSIDEKRIKAPKVKFNCRACNHLIIVERPKDTKESPPKAPDISSSFFEQDNTDNSPKEQASSESALDSSSTVRTALRQSAATSGKGVPFFVYLLAIMVAGFLIITTFFIHFYRNTIPDLLQHQLELRSLALTESLQGTIKSPLARKDYLTVNKEVKRTSKLPGVAYAAVSNKKGIIIAGFFNNLNKFENRFAQKIKEEGFQLDLLTKNTLPPDEEWSGAQVIIGGVPVYDQVTTLPQADSQTGGQLHVGIYIDELDQRFLQEFFSPLTLIVLSLLLLSAYMMFVLLNKLITEPIRTMTNIANRISLGELNLAIMAAGPREIRNLGAALERMRHSMKVAMERLR
ncbi:MAG: HAMP domain-containing protein [Candidatus Electrothrix sp. MAN1_4]|nr:HAMP domain-containing protein [Candidatus Electrothrix sp. MAN1_4]